jgi:hypothetical protein
MIRLVINSGSARNCRVYKNQMIKTDCINVFKHRHTVNTSAHIKLKKTNMEVSLYSDYAIR